MAKVYLLCGKLCSGKTVYAQTVVQAEHAVLLSVDEIMLSLYGTDAGQAHDVLTARLQKYLFQKAAEILSNGISVVLDWGFWTRLSRDEARQFFARKGYPVEMIYMNPPEKVRQEWIVARNSAIAAGTGAGYPVDEGLADKLESLFEEPECDELDCVIPCGALHPDT